MMRCATLAPIDLLHGALTVATARAGGIGLVDAVHLAPSHRTAADAAFADGLRATPRSDAPAIGLRLTLAQLATYRDWLDALASRPHWVVVDGWTPGALPEALATLAAPGREVWLEIGHGADLDAVDSALPFTGWAAKGAECGGWSGRESAFVLAQRLARQARPFLVRGAIGVHNAAACRVAGAHAVVLDDTLWLLRESPLPPRWRALVERLGQAETASAGGGFARPVRTLARPDTPAGRQLVATGARLESEGADAADWEAEAAARLGWGEPDVAAWPVGEGIGRARATAVRFPSVARLVRAVVEESAARVAEAACHDVLADGGPLAVAMGTRYPIVQGPMTRVSDTAAFAEAVAGGGALPLVALALMRGPEVARVLDETASRLGDRAWGVGILGFVPPELRAEQLAEVERARPRFALMSGGRPDQAAALEARGIATFLHAPAPLLRPFLAQGTRRFVFEGGECGGHIGPLHSFALWDYAVDVLAEAATDPAVTGVEALFAGGVHDDLSAAMVAALAAPLAARGVGVGVLMGTAYLFTDEAVASGAITPGFQHAALASGDTVTITTGPGHVIRCAPTPFVETFAARRASLVGDGVSGDALSEALDQLVVGRARVASKGLERVGSSLVPVDEARQLGEGLYMLGEVAALHASTTSIAALHARVATAGERLRAVAGGGAPAGAPPAPVPADVAIIGIAAVVPGASDVDTFWRHVLDGRAAIGEIPRERWDWRLFYDETPGTRDRVASKWGGFIDPIPFDPTRFGIPPKSLPAITPPQLLALELTRRALVDAGFADARPDAGVRARTAVVFGTGNTADLEQLYMTRAALPLLLPEVGEDVLSRLPEWTEESYPGLLGAVVAGRVANRFDFGGPNLTIDAACASSLAALDVAVRELADGRSDLALAGGLEFEMSPQAYMGFSHTRALSPRGRADVFDEGADGIVISEGGVVVVLKRLADAERDGDRVYAVIKAVAGSSDGRGLSMTAPKSDGQRLALERAYGRSGVDPATLRLYEAHGTGTKLGDAAEASTISRVLAAAGAPGGACAIGSIKSLIGHTRTAAGLVALVKAALALYYRVLPPHAGVSRPLDAVSRDDGPLALLGSPRPWLAEPGVPRRAGASAFGFGGTNFHAVLEEHRAPVAASDAPVGAPVWPCEVVVAAADDPAGLRDEIARLRAAADRLEAWPTDGSTPPAITLGAVAMAAASRAARGGAHRMAVVAASAVELRERLDAALARLDGGAASAVPLGHGAPDGGLAFLFPGQGSQAPDMGREVATYFPEVRTAVEQTDAIRAVGAAMWPPAAFTDAARERQARALADTAVAQPAIGALSVGLLDVLGRAGVRADAVAGHSYGEFVALHAAGALDRESLLRLSAARGRAMASVGEDAGTMAIVAVPVAALSSYLDRASGIVVVANINAPAQTVISGGTAAVADVVARVRADGHTAAPLPVAGAFHSPLMTPARDGLRDAIERTTFDAPSLPVHANLDGQPYPSEPAAIRARLVEHLEQRVDFVAQVEALYDAGIRTFVEVGPGRVLCGLVRRTLDGRPHRVVPTDGGLRGLLDAMATLFASGHTADLRPLFERRALPWIDLDRLPALPAPPAWQIDGAHVWAAGASSRTSGVAPFLTLETAALAPRTAATSNALDTLSLPDGADAGVLDVYREYERTMRHFLDQQERMLARVLGGTSGRGADVTGPPGSSLPIPAPGDAAREPAAGPLDVSPAGLASRLVRIVGDRTGYSDDAVGLDQDLEADLGIDSIKRIEIIGTFATSLPATHAQRLQTELDRLTRLRTLKAIAHASAQALEGVAAEPMPDAGAMAGDVARFVVRRVPAPAATTRRVLTGLHVVTADAGGVADTVARALDEAGAAVVVVGDAACRDDASVASALVDARRAHGPVRGVVHLSALGRAAMSGAPEAWREEVGATTRRLFTVLKAVTADLASAPGGAVLAATALGGDWGRTPFAAGAELAAGCHGLLRAWAREYPDVAAGVVDLDPGAPAAAQASRIVSEFYAGDLVEAGQAGDGRTTAAVVPAPLDDRAEASSMRPAPGWVVLATGGARGITADVCQELAGPGVRFVLVGRGGGGADADAERRHTMDALRALGAEAEFVRADVADETAFRAALDDVYARYGRIDAVLHGAGVIADQRFELKPVASFDRVFEAKVGSAETLARGLRPDGLKWVVFFGSVSGRFGNPGQTDYAAANEVLNRLAWRLNREWPSTRVVTVNWGPWRGPGMMSDATLALIEARGIPAIERAAGRRFVAREIVAGTKDEVEVVAGTGPWADSGRQRSAVGSQLSVRVTLPDEQDREPEAESRKPTAER